MRHSKTLALLTAILAFHGTPMLINATEFDAVSESATDYNEPVVPQDVKDNFYGTGGPWEEKICKNKDLFYTMYVTDDDEKVIDYRKISFADSTSTLYDVWTSKTNKDTKIYVVRVKAKLPKDLEDAGYHLYRREQGQEFEWTYYILYDSVKDEYRFAESADTWDQSNPNIPVPNFTSLNGSNAGIPAMKYFDFYAGKLPYAMSRLRVHCQVDGKEFDINLDNVEFSTIEYAETQIVPFRQVPYLQFLNKDTVFNRNAVVGTISFDKITQAIRSIHKIDRDIAYIGYEVQTVNGKPNDCYAPVVSDGQLQAYFSADAYDDSYKPLGYLEYSLKDNWRKDITLKFKTKSSGTDTPSNPSSNTPSNPAKPADTSPKFDSKQHSENYRLYNPNTGEHFYTTSAAERDHLTTAGWNNEKVEWISMKQSSEPVYRVYNPNSGDHHYTKDAHEKDVLVGLGWKDEGISMYANDTGKNIVEVYRLYNPNAKTGNHHYTTNKAEYDHLISLGWNGEGLAWNGLKVK